MRRHPLAVLIALMVLAAGLPGVTTAQARYPERPVRMIVPFAPGGAVDVVARIAAQKLTERLGQSFFVENVAGATGNIGTTQAARAAPDGHTLLVAFSSHVVNPSLFARLLYDPVKDFEPVVLAVTAANVIVVTQSVPARSLEELIGLIRASPGKFSFAATTSTQAHLLGEQFRRALKLDLVHVPFNGAGPAIQAVVGGHTPIAFATLASAVTQIEAGQLRALAVLSRTRAAALPKVPTMAEAGHPQIEGDVWIGVLAPARTPDGITEQLHRELADILKRPDVGKLFNDQGLTPMAISRAAFGTRIVAEIEQWRKIVEAADIKAK